MGICCSSTLESGADYASFPKNVASSVGDIGSKHNLDNKGYEYAQTDPPLLHTVRFQSVEGDSSAGSSISDNELNKYLEEEDV